MTHQGRIERANVDAPATPAEQLIELRAVLAVVERLAGELETRVRPADSASIARRHQAAPGVARRRFAAIARDAAGYAAAGIEALLARAAPNPAAARRLALTLRRSLADMERSIDA